MSKRQLTLLHINKFHYLKGGSEAVYFGTARLLEDHGHRSIFFSMHHPENVFCETSDYFVPYIDLNNKGGVISSLKTTGRVLYYSGARKRLSKLLDNYPVDIAHLHNIYHQISPSILYELKKRRIPVVMTLHDYKMVCASYSMFYKEKVCEACRNSHYFHCFLKSCVKDSKMSSLLNTIEMYMHHKILHIYDLIDIFISPSKFLKNKIKEMGFKGRVVYLPNFVKIEDYEPVYDWRENSIVYVGRLSREKGLFALIDAVKRLNVKLKIIGEGMLRDELVNKVQKDKINNVFFLGYMSSEEIKKEIRKSTLVVAPSEWLENNPRSVIEAFALGKPVIASGIGGIPELVRDDVTGLSFETGNLEDLCFKLEYLINNPDKIIEMGRNARIMVERELNPEKHYERLMEIYKQVI